MFTCLDMLPDVGLRIDDAHVRLLSASIYENPVVKLEEGIARVVLKSG